MIVFVLVSFKISPFLASFFLSVINWLITKFESGHSSTYFSFVLYFASIFILQSLCLSFIQLYIYQNRSIHLFTHHLYPTICYLSVEKFRSFENIHPSLNLSIDLSIFLFIYLPIYPITNSLSFHLYIYQFTSWKNDSLSLSLSLSVCLSVYLSVSPTSIHLSLARALSIYI